MFDRNTYHRITAIAVWLGALVAPSVAAQNTSTKPSASTTQHKSAPCPAMSGMRGTHKTHTKSVPRDSSDTSRTMTSSTANCLKGDTSRVHSRRTTTTSGGEVDLSNSTARPRARSSMRIPVSKEPEPILVDSTPAPAPVVAPPADTAVAPAPTPPPPADTAVTPPPAPLPKMRRYGSRFYYGVSAGPSIPVQSIDNGFNTGYTIDVPIGWEAPFSPLGFRVDFGYTRLGSRDSFRNGNAVIVNGQPQAVFLATDDAQIWSALANAKLRLPWVGRFGAGSTNGLYAVGGVGVNTFRNFNTTFALTNPEFTDNGSISANRETVTRFALDAGGGFQWGFGVANVFVESRYITAFTPHNNASTVPIILGVSFH
jgi:hypothetical protein